MIPLKDNVRSGSFPFFNIVLILVNIAVFSVEIMQPSPQALEHFISKWALYPAPLLNNPWGNWSRVISSTFLHGGWVHLIGNMIYLWVFGDNIEDRVGHFRYLIFYLAVGSAAAMTQVMIFPASDVSMVGASGAIAGVMGAYFVLYPKAKVLTAIPMVIFLKVIEIPAVLYLGFWFIIQAFQGYGNLLSVASGARDLSGVAWWAHAGGFLSGVILIFIFRKSPTKRSYF
ncbi:MAG: rhomboid family intramembrane serine protease [Elusimicrobia bacterium]|nr:rhomboid family intramembrane serine protease [Elusimicrobiota bacterium]